VCAILNYIILYLPLNASHITNELCKQMHFSVKLVILASAEADCFEGSCLLIVMWLGLYIS